MTKCDKCGQEFSYAAWAHRCPGEWEALAGHLEPPPLTSWVEECMAKQAGKP